MAERRKDGSARQLLETLLPAFSLPSPLSPPHFPSPSLSPSPFPSLLSSFLSPLSLSLHWKRVQTLRTVRLSYLEWKSMRGRRVDRGHLCKHPMTVVLVSQLLGVGRKGNQGRHFEEKGNVEVASAPSVEFERF